MTLEMVWFEVTFCLIIVGFIKSFLTCAAMARAEITEDILAVFV